MPLTHTDPACNNSRRMPRASIRLDHDQRLRTCTPLPVSETHNALIRPCIRSFVGTEEESRRTLLKDMQNLLAPCAVMAPTVEQFRMISSPNREKWSQIIPVPGFLVTNIYHNQREMR